MKPIRHITFDIETIPGGDYPTRGDLKVPAQMKKQETIDKWLDDPANLEITYKKRSLSYIEGQIFCIAYKMDDEPTKVVWNNNEDDLIRNFEAAICGEFQTRFDNDVIHPVTWVGHNVKGFDIPYLWLRARKYNCEKLLTVMGHNPNDVKFDDTMQWSCVTDKYKGMVSLDKACKLFGLPGKSGMSGKDVYPAWKDERYQEIADYCIDDVDKTHALAKRLGIM